MLTTVVLIQHRLTDGSHVWDVEIQDEDGNIVIGCPSREKAEALKRALLDYGMTTADGGEAKSRD